MKLQFESFHVTTEAKVRTSQIHQSPLDSLCSFVVLVHVSEADPEKHD